jgi:serine carboxypeptidase-like clade 2
MFFSGDTDGAVSTWGTRQWIEALNWDVKENYRPWKSADQVDGYVIRYDGLDFYTIHGVGHMAPQWKREPMTKMITAYVHHEPI